MKRFTNMILCAGAGLAAMVAGVLVAFVIFGRRVQKSVYGKADGQAGAAADHVGADPPVRELGQEGHLELAHDGGRRLTRVRAGDGTDPRHAADQRCEGFRHVRGRARSSGSCPSPAPGRRARPNR